LKISFRKYAYNELEERRPTHGPSALQLFPAALQLSLKMVLEREQNH
jgi:hypothetical protein